MIGDFTTLPTVTDRTIRKRINRNMEYFNNMMITLPDQMDIHRKMYLKYKYMKHLSKLMI